MVLDKPIVAIAMICYNHEKFIAKAIEGVLMQKTDFRYKLFITDDNSKDNTAAICEKYRYKNLDIIYFESFVKNLGSMGNAIYNLQKCQESGAEYIALCEGDDYWSDPLKLQRQVNFLKRNNDYEMVVHKHDRLVNNNLEIDKNIYQESLTTVDLAKGINFLTLSALFRTNSFNEYVFKLIYEIPYTNFLFLYLSQFGKVRLLNENMGVYRVHGGGIWSDQSIEEKYQISQSTLIKIINYFKDEGIKKILIGKYVGNSLNMVSHFIKQNKFKKTGIYLKESFLFGLETKHFFYWYIQIKKFIYYRIN